MATISPSLPSLDDMLDDTGSDNTDDDTGGVVRPDQLPSRPGEEQLVEELVTGDELAGFERQASEWYAAPDHGVGEYAAWAVRRAYVHSLVEDHVAAGAGGRAKILNALRASKAFKENVVKVVGALKDMAAAGAPGEAAAMMVPDKYRPPQGVGGRKEPTGSPVHGRKRAARVGIASAKAGGRRP